MPKKDVKLNSDSHHILSLRCPHRLFQPSPRTASATPSCRPRPPSPPRRQAGRLRRPHRTPCCEDLSDCRCRQLGLSIHHCPPLTEAGRRPPLQEGREEARQVSQVCSRTDGCGASIYQARAGNCWACSLEMPQTGGGDRPEQ